MILIKTCYIINEEIDLNGTQGNFVHVREFLVNFNKIGGNTILLKIKGNVTGISSVKTYGLNWLKSPRRFWQLYQFMYNFRLYMGGTKIIKQERPDIIHERQTFLGFAGLRLARKFKLPFVCEINAPLSTELGMYYNNFYKLLGNIVQKNIVTNADKIIVVSNELKDYLITMYKINSNRIEVVPNGVDLERFNSSLDGARIRNVYNLGDTPVVCFVGTLRKWHGIDTLLKAAKMISKINPLVKFMIIGDGPCSESLKNDVPDNTIFTGAIDYQKISEYLSAADILVAPYPKMDFFYFSPIKLFEYMAAGKPIIASNIGQISEVIENMQTGILVEPGNVDDLTNNILYLINDDVLMKKLGQNARKKVENEYSWKINAERIMKIYDEILNKS